jgi:hypothetical protein
MLEFLFHHFGHHLVDVETTVILELAHQLLQVQKPSRGV